MPAPPTPPPASPLTPPLASPLPPLPGGPFRRRDALTLGYDDVLLRRLTCAGLVVRLRHGVYICADAPERDGDEWDAHRLDVCAAAKAMSGVAASHQSAAAIHRLPQLGHPPARPQFVRYADSPRAVRSGVTDVGGGRLPDTDVDQVDGVVVTSVPRTVVDLARRSPFRSAVVVADAALHARLAREDLEEVLQRSRHWPGARRAAAVVRFADGRTESPHESITRVAMRELGLPEPEPQVTLGDARRPVGRVDFYFPDHRTVVEADGRLKYLPAGEQSGEGMAEAVARVVLAEKRREEALRDLGLEIVRVLWADAFSVNPELRRRVLRAFARAGARPADGRLRIWPVQFAA